MSKSLSNYKKYVLTAQCCGKRKFFGREKLQSNCFFLIPLLLNALDEVDLDLEYGSISENCLLAACLSHYVLFPNVCGCVSLSPLYTNYISNCAKCAYKETSNIKDNVVAIH